MSPNKVDFVAVIVVVISIVGLIVLGLVVVVIEEN